MRFRDRIHQHYDSSDPDKSINDASEETVSENPCYNVEIKKSEQSSIKSSDHKKNPCGFPEH